MPVDSKTKAVLLNYLLLYSKVNTSNGKLINSDILSDQTLTHAHVTENGVFDELQCLDINKINVNPCCAAFNTVCSG